MCITAQITTERASVRSVAFLLLPAHPQGHISMITCSLKDPLANIKPRKLQGNLLLGTLLENIGINASRIFANLIKILLVFVLERMLFFFFFFLGLMFTRHLNRDTVHYVSFPSTDLEVVQELLPRWVI